jgi:hypothetical protein
MSRQPEVGGRRDRAYRTKIMAIRFGQLKLAKKGDEHAPERWLTKDNIDDPAMRRKFGLERPPSYRVKADRSAAGKRAATARWAKRNALSAAMWNTNARLEQGEPCAHVLDFYSMQRDGYRQEEKGV